RPQMIVLIHYSGSPLYLPSNRYQMSIDLVSSSRELKTKIEGSSPLVHREGDDLQIEGSGYVDFLSTDTINKTELDDAVKLKLLIRLRSASGIVLSAELRPPDWR